MQTIDPKILPTEFRLTDARKAELGEYPRLLDGFLYIGLTVLYSEPGLGKSMLQGQVEEHLAYGRPFGPWALERPVRCMVIDLEGDLRLAATRSLTITPFGLLRSDHGGEMEADIFYATEWKSKDGPPTFGDRLDLLRARLKEAQEAGRPFGYVRIDTMRLFLGSKPHGANAYEHDAFCLRKLNLLAIEFDVALVLIHHTNKAGELSGSTGVAGSATCIAQIKRNPDNDDECVLLSHKVRVDAPFRYALAMDEKGRWSFTEDITPTQAQLGGTKRTIINVLTAQGRMDGQDLRAAIANVSANTVKSALRRLTHDGMVRFRHGMWQLTQATLASHPKCHVCDTPMEAYSPGQHAHPTCVPDPFIEQTVAKFLGTPLIPGQAPAPAADLEVPATHPYDDIDADLFPDVGEEEEHPEVAKFPAYQELRKAVDRSRMKPVRVIEKIKREGAPWTLVTNRLDGAFSTKLWRGTAPEGTQHVVILDRNGSFPSAMSSVPVAPNALLHTGPLGADPLAREGRAGLFLIRVPEWDDSKMPHPLGRAATSRDGDGLVWITSPHIELLDKLAKRGRMPVVDVLDSWTGRRNTSLFEPFYRWSKLLREQTAQAAPELRQEAKKAVVRAIRALHPVKARSPFWRPDWHKSVMAEASVRHWLQADKSVSAGDVLLSIGKTDEVTFAVPADVPAQRLWVPAAYRIGGGFGQVKHKEIKVDGDQVMSPVTLDQWQGHRG